MNISNHELLEQISNNTGNINTNIIQSVPSIIKENIGIGNYTSYSVGILNCACLAVTRIGFQDIDNGNNQFNYLSIGSTFNLVSTSNSDRIGSTGINSILVNGVDNDFNVVSEIINLNGTTGVHSVNSYLVVNSTVILSVGGVGNINCTAIGNISANGVNNNFFKIVAGNSNGFVSRLAVPVGHSFLFTGFSFNCLGTDSADVKIKIKPYGLPIQDSQYLSVPQGSSINNNASSIIIGVVPARTIIQIRGKALTGNDTTMTGIAEFYDVVL